MQARTSFKLSLYTILFDISTLGFASHLLFIRQRFFRYISLFTCCSALCGCMVKPIDTNIVIDRAGIITRHYSVDNSKTYNVLVLGSEKNHFFEFINYQSDEQKYRNFMTEFEQKIKNYSLIFFTKPSAVALTSNCDAILSYKLFLVRNELGEGQATRLENKYKATNHKEFLIVEFKLYGKALKGEISQYENLKPLKTPIKATITHDPQKLSMVGEVIMLITVPIWIFGLKV